MAADPLFVLVGTGGSSGRTLAEVEAALRAERPDARFLFADTQPFHLRTRGNTAYPGRGEVRVFSPEASGIRTWTGSQSANMLLNGGPFAYRRLIAAVSSLFDPRPDLVIICHDRMYVETAILTAARQHGVPTVLLQEGPFCAIGDARPQARDLRLKAALAPFVNVTRLLPSIPDYGLFGHDRILAASRRYAETWQRAGTPAETITVTGIPRFDRIAGLRGRSPAARKDGVVRLLYLAQPFAEHGKVDRDAADAALDLLVEGLNHAQRKIPIELTIRAHPRSGGDIAARLCAGLDVLPVADAGERPIEQAIAQTDATIGHYSTGLLESLLLERPAICIPIPRAAFAERSEAAKQEWLQTIGIPVCPTPDALAASVLALRGSPGLDAVRWDVVEEETGVTDGQATARVANAILQLVEARG